MEANQLFQVPVIIDKEVAWDKTKTIMSKTDHRGIIEYANEVFSDVCGYEDYELMGQPHSIVRHPDMPKIIFKVLWDNLNQGNNFHAIVKNLAKSGRYYWVVTDFEVTKNEAGEVVNIFGKRKSVPNEIIQEHIEPLYKKLLQIENASGVTYSEKYLIGFLEEQKCTYIEFVVALFAKYEASQANVASELNNEETITSKNFFKRFFLG